MNVTTCTACATNIALDVTTVGVAIAAATATSTVAMATLGVLAIVLAGFSLAAATAFFDDKSVSPAKYFAQIGEHVVYTIPGLFKVAAQVLIKAIIQGVAEGVSTGVRRKIAGK